MLCFGVISFFALSNIPNRPKSLRILLFLSLLDQKHWFIPLFQSSEDTNLSWHNTFSVFVTFQEGRNLSELRDVVLSVATLFLQLLQTVQELPAGQTGVNTPQLLVNLPPFKHNNTTSSHLCTLIILRHASAFRTCTSFSPCGYFFCCVLHGGQRVPSVTKKIHLWETIWIILSA